MMFAVTPRAGEEALGRVREALKSFLAIPSAASLELTDQPDVAAQQLETNVLHLKSQLLMASATIELKDATIQILQSGRDISILDANPESDSEMIVGDMVEIKKYEGPGFAVNFPELLRRLKRRFRRD